MGLKRIDLAFYTVGDLQIARDFYRNKLGLHEKFFDPRLNWAEYALPGGKFNIAVTELKDEEAVKAMFQTEQEESDSKYSGATVVIIADDFANTLGALEERGVKFLDEPQTGGVRYVNCADPFGNVIQIVDEQSLPTPKKPKGMQVDLGEVGDGV